MFMATALYTADLRYYYTGRHSTSTDENTVAAIRETGLADMERCFPHWPRDQPALSPRP